MHKTLMMIGAALALGVGIAQAATAPTNVHNVVPQYHPIVVEREGGNGVSAMDQSRKSLESKALGVTYCQKMLRACDGGNQSACALFQKNCEP